jgi:hypothetical protein
MFGSNRFDANGNVVYPEKSQFFIKCPDNQYYKEQGCPIPDCSPGYIPVPYHCKFDQALLEGNNI